MTRKCHASGTQAFAAAVYRFSGGLRTPLGVVPEGRS
jgi:hypothetical protein